MRISELQPTFLCPQCAQRLRSSLRYCDGDEHDLKPVCPEHHQVLRWTTGGDLAVYNTPTGHDSRGRRTWCRVQRDFGDSVRTL